MVASAELFFAILLEVVDLAKFKVVSLRGFQSLSLKSFVNDEAINFVSEELTHVLGGRFVGQDLMCLFAIIFLAIMSRQRWQTLVH